MKSFDTLNALFMQLVERKIDTVLLLGHINPDGDAVGSVMGTAYYLKHCFPGMFQQIIPYIADGLPNSVRDYVEQDDVFAPFSPVPEQLLKKGGYAAVACDCASPERIAGREWYEKADVKITLDHHEGNPGYGDFGHVSYRSSCAEVIAQGIDFKELSESAKQAHAQGKRSAAEYLYLGMVHDTRGFKRITGAQTFDAAAQLLRCGIDYKSISNTLDARSLQECRQEGALLNCVQTAVGGQVAYLYLPYEKAQQLNVAYEDMKRAADRLSDCVDVKVGMVFLEQTPGHWRASCRTNKNGIELSHYLAPYGGGGHPYAAGLVFLSDEPGAQQILKNILSAMEAELS